MAATAPPTTPAIRPALTPPLPPPPDVGGGAEGDSTKLPPRPSDAAGADADDTGALIVGAAPGTEERAAGAATGTVVLPLLSATIIEVAAVTDRPVRGDTSLFQDVASV